MRKSKITSCFGDIKTRSSSEDKILSSSIRDWKPKQRDSSMFPDPCLPGFYITIDRFDTTQRTRSLLMASGKRIESRVAAACALDRSARNPLDISRRSHEFVRRARPPIPLDSLHSCRFRGSSSTTLRSLADPGECPSSKRPRPDRYTT